ncbi:MAG: succinylglutamate desuccinylase/aspartoacylase family protein [Lachnospiraceae bacterium]|nr:succinylglutamate desuccinylase/aspartoacylase family protein [Candidatus Equihabitans merdae]
MTQDVTFAGITAKSGEIVKTEIPFGGSKYKIPVAIINGKEDGKTFLITASIHGFEYPGIQAAAELISELDPSVMSGAVVIIPIVNTSGFYGRHPYICPEDENFNNLNRVGPGKPDGTFAERLIYFLEEEFVKKSNFHVDLHSGDATEALLRFCAIGNAQSEETREFVHEIVHHLDFHYHTQSSGSTEFYNSSAKYAGVPSMMFECGGRGSWDPEEVEFEKECLRRIMQMLDILPGKPEHNEKVQCIDRQSWIECGQTGFFYGYCKVGDDIKEGQKLYEIRDVWGNLLEDHYAAYDGKVFILNNTLGVSKGDDAIFYGSVKHLHDHCSLHDHHS